ncbi:MAG: DoxX family protein [candidate division NC10 bacterium]|jgi:putative oxidoreductase|nr:DoxX family protein [candidate division NC10 bacterium]MBW8058493.1 DoxX family protein [candidate division NC10 bacterium]
MMRRGSGYGITVLRVTLGIIFLLHGYLAVFVYTPAGVTAFNAKMGIPLPAIMAWFVILGHFLGGASLVLGFFTRIGALVHVVIMGGAIFFVHLREGFFLHGMVVDAAAGKAAVAGYEYALVLLMASIAILITGGGPLALDGSRRRL